MVDKNQHIDFDTLINRQVEGVIDSIEAKQLLEWVNASPENKTHYQTQLKLIYQLRGKSNAYNSTKAYHAFLKTVNKKPKQSFIYRRILQYAAVAAVLIGMSIWIIKPVENKETIAEVATTNKVIERFLPDSSVVHLNKSSHIVYSSAGCNSTREVTLTGNAFFEVKPNKQRPFKITVGNVVVEVLGTSFDVSQDTTSKTVSVSVLTGLVKVSCPSQNIETLLHPQQRCKISCNSGLSIDSVAPSDNYLSWMTNELRFSNARLQDVVHDLNRYFNCKIILATSDLANQRFSSTLRGNTLDESLKLLTLTLNLEIEYTNDFILLKDKK